MSLREEECDGMNLIHLVRDVAGCSDYGNEPSGFVRIILWLLGTRKSFSGSTLFCGVGFGILKRKH
jgi:hypothetical protein